MAGTAFDLIAFDGDDTLWHNERSYRDGRERFRRLLAEAGVELSSDEIEARVNETEHANLTYFGYGVSSFTLSLIETAIAVTGGRISSAGLHALIDLAKEMMSERVDVFPGVAETLAALAASGPLMLITKGDLLHQTSKLERSGLQPYFQHVEVVSDKTPAVYRRILGRHGVDPARFLMVGNSLRSDVLPVIDAGGWAVHVPAELGWAHEHAVPESHHHAKLIEVRGLNEILAVVARFGSTDYTDYTDYSG
jgi:putative hydrolase of the HAD superfamily